MDPEPDIPPFYSYTSPSRSDTKKSSRSFRSLRSKIPGSGKTDSPRDSTTVANDDPYQDRKPMTPGSSSQENDGEEFENDGLLVKLGHGQTGNKMSVRPVLPRSRRAPPSMPAVPTNSRAVHFDSHLEHVRHFLQLDRPLAISGASPPPDIVDSDSDYPFLGGDRSSSVSRSNLYEWTLIVTNFPEDTEARKAMPVRLERVWLSEDQKCLNGCISVANLDSVKVVVCRFTLDYWKTTSEVVAEYSNEILPDTTPRERFTFTIKLSDVPNLETKMLFLCIRYRVNGQEFWDNNSGLNFQVDFRKKLLPQRSEIRFRGKFWDNAQDDFGASFAAGIQAAKDSLATESGSPNMKSQGIISTTASEGNQEVAAGSSSAPNPISGFPFGVQKSDEKRQSFHSERGCSPRRPSGSDRSPQTEQQDADNRLEFMKPLSKTLERPVSSSPDRFDDYAFKEGKGPGEDANNSDDDIETHLPGDNQVVGVTYWRNTTPREEVPDPKVDPSIQNPYSTFLGFADSGALETPQTIIHENPETILDTPERDNDDDYTDSDQSSDISSLWDATSSERSSAATSGLPSGPIRLSMQELADVILDDNAGLAVTLMAAMTHPSLRSEDVLEEFKRLMGYYYRDLKKSSTSPDLDRIARLFKKSSGIIANEARKLLGLLHAAPLFPDPREKMSQREKNEMIQYLLEQAAGRSDGEVMDGEDDGSEEDDENEYPEISAARAFLKDGAPMQKFQADLRQFILDAARDHDVPMCTESLPRSLPNMVDEIWCRLRLNLPEPRISRGKRRIRWDLFKLYDDFDERLDSTALNELERCLNRASSTKRNNNSCQNEGKSIVSRAWSWVARHTPLLSLQPGSRSAEMDLPTYNSTTTTNSTNGENSTRSTEPTRLLYLLYCTSKGTYGVKFHQNLIHDKLNDQELFRFLRTVYTRARKETKWLTLRTTTNISLCKFFVDSSHYASVRKHDQGCNVLEGTRGCVCLPPSNLVGPDREYLCHPIPPNLLPPFEKNYLMHYFLHPEDLSPDQAWAFTQLPKRMDSTLQPGTESFVPGWGIYFEDGWHFKTIYLLVSLATVVGSLIFGVCWGVLKLDVQGAFGITGYWVAVVGMGLGFLTLRSTDKL
ncbi:hypothetical protein B0H66DRAFT_623462 [Apodospora peruviana]|uniref:CBM21 domain-containing protein n=1 Tax=Apodospora peruviana TaxID=516989 RepID=A0AAE0I5X0_9PEZI|nr:hypothetical protein B0H66DRAFT_623462 [Apodospora peruviana]